MNKQEVLDALDRIHDDRTRWSQAQAEYQASLDRVMARLLHEAAANRMSEQDVAKATGFTLKQIRARMKAAGLNHRDGRTLLAGTAARALAENAALLGIEPRDMDLSSPLAYLPMGGELRADLASTAVVTELDDLAEFVCPIPGCNCDVDYRAEL